MHAYFIAYDQLFSSKCLLPVNVASPLSSRWELFLSSSEVKWSFLLELFPQTRITSLPNSRSNFVRNFSFRSNFYTQTTKRGGRYMSGHCIFLNPAIRYRNRGRWPEDNKRLGIPELWTNMNAFSSSFTFLVILEKNHREMQNFWHLSQSSFMSHKLRSELGSRKI